MEKTNKQLMADWQTEQEKVWTRWMNTFLDERMLKINNLITDLADGVLLANFLEIITGKELKFNKTPKMKIQKLENLGACFNFLKQQDVKLIAIGPEDIVNGLPKLVLALIWAIALKFQILKAAASGSAKVEILSWVQKTIPDSGVNNLTNDWNDGKAICSLVGVFTGEQIDSPDRAIALAKEKLNIPPILDGDHFRNPDELCLILYLSYFLMLKPEGTTEARWNPYSF